MGLPRAFKDIAKDEKPKKARRAEPESWVKDQIKKACAEEAPESWWYMPVQGPEGEHGIPDHVGCVPVTVTPEMVGQKFPMFVAIEAKADDGKVSPIQANCHKRMKAAWALVWIVRGRKGVADLRDKLRALIHAGN